MATTATVIDPAPLQFPFIGIGVPAAQLATPIPSAEVSFVVNAEAVTVAAAGEDQSLQIRCFLERSFCWVLAECSMRITNADANEWDPEGIVNYSDSTQASLVAIPLVLNSLNVIGLSASKVRNYQINNLPTKVIVPASTDSARLSVFLRNTTIDGAAGTVEFYARFLRYDRNQAQHWYVNTPQYIR